jgi:glycosyltransferase involved in cell wall biosynthesis
LDIDYQNKESLKVVHIISSLERGGAQGILMKLVIHSDKKKYSHYIISLKSGNAYQDIIVENQLEDCIFIVDKKRVLSSLIGLFRFIKEIKPDILHSWMYHADLFTSLLKPFFGSVNIIWSFHHASPMHNKWLSYSIAKICSYLSYFVPNKIISVSDLAKKEHIAFGYDEKKIQTINNGVDNREFVFSEKNIKDYSQEKLLTIGFIGRYHPIKGYDVFIKSAEIISKKYPDLRFIMIGSNMNRNNINLIEMLRRHNLEKVTKLYGEEVKDIRKYYNMMDIYICTSYSESFSLTLVESAFLGIPSISTDVGIAKDIISESNLVVRIGDNIGIVNSIISVLQFSKKQSEDMLKANFDKAFKTFTLDRMIEEYQYLYDNNSH